MIVGNIANFSNANFYIPQGIKTNDIMLQLTDDEETNIGKVEVIPFKSNDGGVATVRDLKPGEKIYIIKKASVDEDTLAETTAIDKELTIDGKE